MWRCSIASGKPRRQFSTVSALAKKMGVTSFPFSPRFLRSVTLEPGAFSIALHPNITVNGTTGQTAGTLPTLSWSSPDSGTHWVVTFSGAGVSHGSIADGVYDITLDGTRAVNSSGQTIVTTRTDTFYRLFGDSNGDAKVDSTDSTAYSGSSGVSNGSAGYLAYFDSNDDGTVDSASTDHTAFTGNSGVTWTAFTSGATSSVIANGYTATIDPNSHITTMVMDAAGQTIASVDATGARTTNVYDNAGNLVNQIDPRGDKSTYVYDAANRQVNAIDGAGDKTTTVYDAAGNVVNTIDGAGNKVTYVYDAANREVNTIDGNNHKTTTVYDAVGNVVNQIDGAGDKTTSVYDAANRLVNSIDADGNKTTLAYDAAGNETKVIDPDGNVTTFAFDADNRVVTKVDPNGTTTYVYDSASRLTKTIDQLGQTVSVTFDADSRETGEKWYNAGNTLTNTLTYTYDAASNMLTAADANGKYTFTYDADNRMATQKDMFGTTNTYSYDAAGNLTGIVDSLGGTQTMVYDAANRETTVQFSGNSQTLSESITYTANSQAQNVNRYSDVAGTTLIGSTSFTYDAADQVTNIHHRNGSAANITNVTYTYDAANNLSTQTRDSATTTYSYDASGQITGDGTTTYAYDANGNRNNAGFSVTTNNQITTDGTWTYTYDNAGEITQKSLGASSTTWNYTYDERHQMTSAIKHATPGGTVQETDNYTYDVFGDLITEAVTISGVTTTTNTAFRISVPEPGIVKSVNQAWADLDAGDALLVHYLFDAISQSPFARENSGGVAWLLKDNLGGTIVAVNGSGTVLAAAKYDAFGNVTVTTGSSSDLGVILFAGYRWDAETGLYSTHWRWYNPATGQWTTVDPIGFAAGDVNLHRVVENDTSRDTDPSGLQPLSLPASYPGLFNSGPTMPFGNPLTAFERMTQDEENRLRSQLQDFYQTIMKRKLVQGEDIYNLAFGANVIVQRELTVEGTGDFRITATPIPEDKLPTFLGMTGKTLNQYLENQKGNAYFVTLATDFDKYRLKNSQVVSGAILHNDKGSFLISSILEAADDKAPELTSFTIRTNYKLDSVLGTLKGEGSLVARPTYIESISTGSFDLAASMQYTTTLGDLGISAKRLGANNKMITGIVFMTKTQLADINLQAGATSTSELTAKTPWKATFSALFRTKQLLPLDIDVGYQLGGPWTVSASLDILPYVYRHHFGGK